MSVSPQLSEERHRRRVLGLFTLPGGKYVQEDRFEEDHSDADGIGFSAKDYLERLERNDQRINSKKNLPSPRRRKARSSPVAA